MSLYKENKINKFEIVNNIFKAGLSQEHDPLLRSFKKQVYKEIEKYEFHKKLLFDEIEKSTRRINLIVWLLAGLSIFYLILVSGCSIVI
ncbi:MAG TPA: hypothetical protein VGO09_02085 [Flavisolibacter sp.]|nr:hypothetical protein [Flavisolibacter sp.]